MDANLTRRKHYRSFTMDTPFPSPKQVLALRSRLACILMNAPSLSHRDLEFGKCLKDVLERSPALFSAIQSLPQLATLSVDPNTMPWPHRLVRVHNAPLVELDLGYLTIDTPDAFVRHAASLRSFSVGGQSIEATFGRTAYPNMRSLHWIGENEAEAWDISVMMDLFPNLEKLSVWTRLKPNGLPTSTILSYNTIRTKNMKRQSDSERRWPHLRQLSGNSDALFMLSPDCQFDTVSISASLEPYDSTERMCAIVRNLRSPLRTLHLQYSSSWPRRLAERLSTLLLGTLIERGPLMIDFLVVELVIPSDASSEQVWDIATAWPVLIGRIAPQNVLLHVHIARSGHAWRLFHTAAEKYVQGDGVFALGRAIGATKNVAEMIIIRTSWQGGHNTKGWSNVSGPRAELRLIELEDAGLGDWMENTVDNTLSSLAR
ncbi:hypothetical protein PENSPDRAFT_752537 [Peniophora sp. CONT]|nr:hypothetical protein PENSPDRAFT_752537 [Peniophora sp. CONT]